MCVKNQIQDLAVWKAFVDGDKDAYAAIYKRFAKAMYVYGLHYTSDYELIEDAIHDIFVKIYNDRKKLPEVNNLKFYLFISLRNTLFNRLSKNNETFKLDKIDPLFFASSYNIEEEIILNEKSEQDRKIIKTIEQYLSSRQKQVLYYKYVEQLSYKEIADIMGVNIQSAKNMVQITLKKIRSLLPDLVTFPLFFLLFF